MAPSLLWLLSSMLSKLEEVFRRYEEEEEEEEMAEEMASKQGGGKKKIGQTDARTRRVLRDIGNLKIEPSQGGKWKPQPQLSRPLTRRYHAQLIANKAQAAADKENKKLPPGVVQEKKNDEPIPLREFAMNAIDELNQLREEKIPINGRLPRKSLTSILTAHSQAACGISADSPINIDELDSNNELAQMDYVEEIYKFYREIEEELRVNDYMQSQPDINLKMRAILIDWLIEVHRKFELVPESLYLTIYILDRYLSMVSVTRKELQLVGITAMLIASKYEEIWAPEVNDLVVISDNAYARTQLLVTEKVILGKLEWFLTVPTAYMFLSRFIKASNPSDSEMENMVYFLAELGLMNYATVISYSSSMISASAVYAARCTLNIMPFWTRTLQRYTGYQECQLQDCAKVLVGFHREAATSRLRAVYKKFSSPERGAVAHLPPPINLLE